MLKIGKAAPDFTAQAVIGGNADTLTPDNAYKTISLSDYRGKWLVFFFYPLDFTFVCPTEIEGFGKAYSDFKDLDCEVLTASTDSKQSHLAWRKHTAELKNLPYPMLADYTKSISEAYGVLNDDEGYAERGLFIIDPDGILQYMVVHPSSVGRSVEETLRVLAAIQTDELCPCNWKKGDATL